MVISIYDYLLLPFYLLFFFFIAYRASRNYTGELKNFFFISFLLHLFGSVAFALLIQYYFGIGDSISYYQGGEILTDIFQKDPSNLKLVFASGKEIQTIAENMGFGDRIPINIVDSANAAIMKVSALFSYFSFFRYIEINLFFGMLAFIGNWKIFSVMNEMNGRRNTKWLACFILCIPSLWFWSSGLGKEAICVLVLGMMISSFYNLFVLKQKALLNVLVFCLFTFLLTIVKSYITVVFFVSMVLVLFLASFRIIKNRIIRIAAIVVSMGLIFFIISISPLPGLLEKTVTDSLDEIELFQDLYKQYAEESKGETTFSNLDLSPQGMLANSPAVVLTTLYRPFIWESRKIIMLISALESLLTLFATLFVLWKTRFFGFFVNIFNDRLTLFCFIFSLLFAAIVGFSTFNFGTLVRYRIILLPFYYFMLISIYSRYKPMIKEKN